MHKEEIVKKFNTNRYGEFDYSKDIDVVRLPKLLAGINPKDHVLDIGCGDGKVMERILSSGATAEGLEISERSLKIAKKKGLSVHKINILEPWAHKLESKFDIVVAGEIIEHLYDTDMFLQQIRKVLKKGGKLKLSTPNVASLGRRIYLLFGKNPMLEFRLGKDEAGHMRYFTFAALKELIESNGFEVKKMEGTVVNFDNSGNLCSKFLADIFPTISSTIVVTAIKN